jgi:predicted MFS family arabinose efflux permease
MTHPADTATRTRWREVFGEPEYRALWLAQLVSITGDQLARVALGVLVYDRTRSALLAGITFAVTTGAMTIGALGLSWTADRYPRRAVMLVSDLACTILVMLMIIPGMPLWAMVALLFAVGLAIEPFLSARMTTNREILGGKRFRLGQSVTITTYQVAQLGGFAVAGVIVAAAGTRTALWIDAASFALSFIIIRARVRKRPAPERDPGGYGPQIGIGARLIFGNPQAATAMGLLWLAAFFAAPEGVMAPLAHQYGGAAAAVGWLFAANTAGSAVGMASWTRLLTESRLTRLAALLALASCVTLTLFAFPVQLAGAMIILFVSGLFTGYIPAASGVLMDAIPDEHRGKASGLIGAGMSLGQGVGIAAAGALAGRITPSLAIAAFGAAGTLTAAALAVAWQAARSAQHNPDPEPVLASAAPEPQP